MIAMESKINKKMRKPLMEKKRRARINRSLDELYQLLADTDLITQGTKLEKADILQMTVQYMKNLKHNIYRYESEENFENLIREKYLFSFEKDIQEINFLIKEITKINPRLTKSIILFLKHFLEKIRKESKTYPTADPHLLQENGRKHLSDCKMKCTGKENCLEMFREYKKLKISSSMPRKNENSLLPPNINNCEKNLSKGDMWRPWW